MTHVTKASRGDLFVCKPFHVFVCEGFDLGGKEADVECGTRRGEKEQRLGSGKQFAKALRNRTKI